MKKKKICGAVLSTILASSFLIFYIGLAIFGFRTNILNIREFIIIIIVLGIPVFLIIYTLLDRIKEIRNGEEDEASKY